MGHELAEMRAGFRELQYESPVPFCPPGVAGGPRAAGGTPGADEHGGVTDSYCWSASWHTARSIPLDQVDGINGPNTVIGGTWPPVAHNQGGMWETGFSSYHPGGCHFLFCDGSVHFLSENLSADVIKALTTRAGGSDDPTLPGGLF